MKKESLESLKKKLEKEKSQIESELKRFAKKDRNLEGDWDTVFPKFNGGVGGQILEEGTDEVEEYSTRLPIEFSLELRLKDINLALDKIKHPRRGYPKYGICEKCGKKISQSRLTAYPEARTCAKCQKK